MRGRCRAATLVVGATIALAAGPVGAAHGATPSPSILPRGGVAAGGGAGSGVGSGSDLGSDALSLGTGPADSTGWMLAGGLGTVVVLVGVARAASRSHRNH